MRTIRQEKLKTRGRARGWIAVPASVVAVGLVATLGYTVVPGLVSENTGSAASAEQDTGRTALEQIIKGAKLPAPVKVRDDQWVYASIKSASMSNQGTPNLMGWALMPLSEVEVWSSPDDSTHGRREDDGTLYETRAHPSEPMPRLSSQRGLESLPLDADKLLARILAETKTKGEGQTHEDRAFDLFGELVRDGIVPPELSPVLLRAALQIKGVSFVPDAVDAADRHGFALSRVDAQDGERVEYIFDPVTLEYLGSHGVQELKTSAYGGVTPGTVTEQSAVLKRGVVDKSGEVPAK